MSTSSLVYKPTEKLKKYSSFLTTSLSITQLSNYFYICQPHRTAKWTSVNPTLVMAVVAHFQTSHRLASAQSAPGLQPFRKDQPSMSNGRYVIILDLMIQLIRPISKFISLFQGYRQCESCRVAWKNLDTPKCGRCASVNTKSVTPQQPVVDPSKSTFF